MGTFVLLDTTTADILRVRANAASGITYDELNYQFETSVRITQFAIALISRLKGPFEPKED